MTTIGIIGAGHIGSALARGFAQHGYDVVISNSRGPESLAGLVADITSEDILTDGTPAGTPDRRALATSSDVDDAAELVTRIYDEFGFDTVNIGPLADSWRVERDRPAYVVRQNADELRANLARAER